MKPMSLIALAGAVLSVTLLTGKSAYSQSLPPNVTMSIDSSQQNIVKVMNGNLPMTMNAVFTANGVDCLVRTDTSTLGFNGMLPFSVIASGVLTVRLKYTFTWTGPTTTQPPDLHFSIRHFGHEYAHLKSTSPYPVNPMAPTTVTANQGSQRGVAQGILYNPPSLPPVYRSFTAGSLTDTAVINGSGNAVFSQRPDGIWRADVVYDVILLPSMETRVTSGGTAGAYCEMRNSVQIWDVHF